MLLWVGGLFLLAALQPSMSEHRPSVDLHKLESARMLAVSRKYRDMNISVDVFFHMSAWKQFWKEIVHEQLFLLDGRILARRRKAGVSESPPNWGYSASQTAPSVASIARHVYIMLHGDESSVREMRAAVVSSKVSFLDKIIFSQSETIERSMYSSAEPVQKLHIRAAAEKAGATAGEYATIQAVHQHCKKEVASSKNSVVLYIHNKGGCCRKGEAPESDWRDLMNTLNIEFSSVCLRALYDGYSACGADYQDMHYSGNFWWASCNHVAMLPGLWDPIDNAWQAEFFLFNISENWHRRDPFGHECAYRPYHCHVNHYNERCQRTKYVSALSQLLESDEMPFVGYSGMSEPTFVAPNREWDGGKCLSVQVHSSDMAKVVPYYSRNSRKDN